MKFLCWSVHRLLYKLAIIGIVRSGLQLKWNINSLSNAYALTYLGYNAHLIYAVKRNKKIALKLAQLFSMVFLILSLIPFIIIYFYSIYVSAKLEDPDLSDTDRSAKEIISNWKLTVVLAGFLLLIDWLKYEMVTKLWNAVDNDDTINNPQDSQIA